MGAGQYDKLPRLPLARAQLSERRMVTYALRHVRRLIRRPAFIGALAAGVVVTACIDITIRHRCPPTGNFFGMVPRGTIEAVLSIEDWDTAMSGFASESWAWSDVDLSDAVRGTPSSLMKSTNGERLSAISSALAARQYRIPSLIDVAPVDDSFGAVVRIRATQFGFPFRSSVRETVWGVLRRRTQTVNNAGTARPAALAVCFDSGWAWSENPSREDQRSAANGGWAHRQWVLPLGAIGNWMVYSALLYVVLSAPHTLRARLRSHKGRCIACGYSLHGLNGAKCPECGSVRTPQPPGA